MLWQQYTTPSVPNLPKGDLLHNPFLPAPDPLATPSSLHCSPSPRFPLSPFTLSSCPLSPPSPLHPLTLPSPLLLQLTLAYCHAESRIAVMSAPALVFVSPPRRHSSCLASLCCPMTLHIPSIAR